MNMNKEDILAGSRAENQGNDEYEKQVLEKAGRVSAVAGLLACCIIAVANAAVTGQMNYGYWTIYFAVCAALFWTKHHYLRKRRDLGLAVACTAVGLLCILLFILELAGRLHG